MAVTTTEILVDGSTADVSSTVALEQGEVNTLVLRGADKHSGLEIEIQTSAGWVAFGGLSMKNKVEQVFGPGNYRLVRNAGTQAAADKVV